MSYQALAYITALMLGTTISPQVSAETNFGGPDTVDNTIKENTRTKQTWRENLASENNLTFGVDYNALGLSATDANGQGDDTASSGVARFYGAWNLVGLESGNTGGLVWKVEHRHSYSALSPKEFSFIGNGIGYAGMIGPAYSDQGTRLTNLYWKQKLNGGKTAFMAGYLDTTDYVDTYALASPWTGFTNLAFSTGAGAIGLPDDGILGLAVGHMFSDNVYGVISAADANGDSSNPEDGFDTLFNDTKLFTSLEFGWTSSQEQIYTDNVHITAWSIDGGTKNNISTITLPDGTTTYSNEDASGINFSASYFVTPQLMPFVRAGISEGDVALYQKTLSAGIGYFGLGGAENVLGFAINWSEVNESLTDAYGVEESQQFTSEIYYNYKVNEYIQISPDLQYINNPAFSDKDSTWIFGLRVKITL